MAQPNGQGPLIRPEHLDKLPSLDENKKALYKSGLTRLWAAYEAHEKGTREHLEAEHKIRQASGKIMQDVSKATRPGLSAGAQQQQARPASMGGQNAAQGRPNPQQAVGQQSQQLPSQNEQQQQQQQQQQNGQQAQQAVQSNQVLPKVRALVDQITINIPSNVPQDQHNVYRSRWYQEAVKTLMTKERVMASGRAATQRISQAQSSGQEVPLQWREQVDAAKRNMKELELKWTAMQTTNDSHGKGRPAGVLSQNMGQPGQPAMSNNVGQNQGNQAGARAPQDVKQDLQNGAGSPVQGFQQQAGQAAPAQAAQAGQNFPQGQGVPVQRPTQNVAPNQGAVGQQQAVAVAAAMNAQNQNNQRPQPLSQQAAVAQAQEQYARGQATAQGNVNTPQQAIQPQVANAMAFPPQSASQNTPSSAYPPQNQMQGPTNKFPIPKQLTLDPRTQQPVAGPPSRPTLANQGMSTQPGLTRPQPFTLEGEGDRVLSKRKLDELVRQVTGSSDTSPEAGGLTPDVEDAVLSLADDFVDNVVTSACRLAKLRSGQTLDIKDVQMVLERNYGIRIPGYSLDEVRTVRKFQPAPGWQSKMQAIQTAKTLGGVKGDS